MKIEDADDLLVLTAAFRYALWRSPHSSLPKAIAAKLTEHWSDLSRSDRAAIRANISSMIEKSGNGWDYDVVTWRRLLDLPV